MQRLRQANLGDGGHRDARLQVALTVWFWAAYLMAIHSNGISALQLARQLGLGSYKTAWLLCAKLRRAMVAPDRNPLAGIFEIDETTIRCRTGEDPVAGGGGRSGNGKMLIAGAVEVVDNRPGRVRLAAISSFSAASLHAFVKANVAPGTTAKTDGWPGYEGAPGVAHDPHVIGSMAAHIVLPWSHRVFSNLKRWALDVYHGLRRKHLQSYLDEFVFSFNRRRTRHAAFRSLLGIGTTTLGPLTYQPVEKVAARSCRRGGDGEDEKGAVFFAAGGCDGKEDDCERLFGAYNK